MANIKSLENRAKKMLKEVVRDAFTSENDYRGFYLGKEGWSLLESLNIFGDYCEIAYTADELPDTDNLGDNPEEDTIFIAEGASSWYNENPRLSLNEIHYDFHGGWPCKAGDGDENFTFDTHEEMVKKIMEDYGLDEKEAEENFSEYASDYNYVVWMSISFDEFFERLYKKMSTDTPAINYLLDHEGTSITEDIGNLDLYVSGDNLEYEEGWDSCYLENREYYIKEARNIVKILEKKKDTEYLNEALENIIEDLEDMEIA